MKKLLIVLTVLFIFTGCGNMDNTPSKKVENLMTKYQTNDSKVLDDLDNVLLSDDSLTDDERSDYKLFMEKHYKDMIYKIKDEKIDGDSATVTVEITVRDYSDTVNEANEYRASHADEFDSERTFPSYRLDKLKGVSDTETYTIVFHLTKSNEEWRVDPLSTSDEEKLNGLYGVRDVNNISSSRDSVQDNNDMDSDMENSSDNTQEKVD